MKRADYIRDTIKDSGTTQTFICKQLGISLQALQLWITGKMSSSRIEKYFRDKYGLDFINVIYRCKSA